MSTRRSRLLKISPGNGAICIAGDRGFYRSTDGGRTFKRNLVGTFSSLDAAGPSGVLVATQDTLSLSRDAGETFAPIPHTGISAFYRIKVSPPTRADPRRLLCQNPQDNGERHYFRDGGAIWAKSGKDLAQSWIPPEILCNDRARLVAWHPTDPNLAWGIGPGDIVTRTANAGAMFRRGNNDNNGIMTGGLFNFNAQNPDVLYFGSQDYNLWITFDGGKTTTQKAVNLAGAQVSLGDPVDPKVLFCWNQRSTDRGGHGRL